MTEKRKKIWIDRFQTALSLRISLYFVLYAVAVGAILWVERSFLAGLERLIGHPLAPYAFLFQVLTLALVGLLFIWDAVRYAHRIVGPLHRFRTALKAVAAGEPVELLNLRQGDLLHEMKDEFNDMLKALEQLGAIQIKPPEAKQDEKRPVGV